MGTLVVANNVVDTLLGKMNDCKIATDSIAYKMGQIVEHSEYTTEGIQQLINIKSQEFEQSIFGMPIPLATIIIPTAISILIFILGDVFSKYSQKRKKRAEILSYKDSIVDWVDKLNGSVQQQQQNLEEFIKKINNSDELQPEAFSQNLIILNKLKEISLKEWNDIIVINLTGDKSDNQKRMTNVVYYIEYIDAIYHETQDFYWRYHTGMNDLRRKWNSNYLDLMDRGWQNQCNNFQFLNYLNGCLRNVKNYQSLKDLNINFIQPMQQFIYIPTNCSPDTAIAERCIKNLAIVISEWGTHNSGNVVLFTEKKEQLLSAFSELQKNIKEIANTDIVSVNEIK